MAQDFTVDRASKKWVLGDSGVLVEYDIDEPAIEFNADGSYKGVLVEPASTNDCLQSEDWSISPWEDFTTGVGITPTITADAGTAPDGTSNATRVQLDCGDIASSANRSARRQIITISNSTEYTASFWYKAYDASAIGNTIRVENLNLGSASIITLTADWQRYTFTGTSTSTSTNIFLETRGTYTGQTADVLVWGAQLEASPIATSYIPTTTGSVTRVADDIYMTSASSLIGQTEGTLFFEVDWRLASGSRQYLIDINSSVTNNDRIFIRIDTNDFIRFQVDTNSSPGNVLDTTESADLSGIYKIAFAYKSTDSKIAINGTSIDPSTDISFSFTNNLSDIYLGQNYVATQQANMHIRTVALYKTKLSDAECEALTTL